MTAISALAIYRDGILVYDLLSFQPVVEGIIRATRAVDMAELTRQRHG